MTDVKMPDSIPCRFNKGYRGKCKKPSDNGWCSEHEHLTCVSCDAKATGSCSSGISLVCGAVLCSDCKHSPSGYGHVTSRVAKEMFDKQEAERQATIASRTSPEQRMNEELGVPLNLFELLKTDHDRYQFKRAHLLELEHGLMGFFPAVFCGSDRMVVTTDEELLKEVWKTLSPRRSKIWSPHGHVNKELGIVYLHAEDQFQQERSEPIKLLTRVEFEELMRSDGDSFEWAPGLIGDDMSAEDFTRTIEDAAIRYDVALP